MNRTTEADLDAIAADALVADQAKLLAHWQSQSYTAPPPELDLADAMAQDHDEIAPKPATCIRTPMFARTPIASRAVGLALLIGGLWAIGAGLWT